MSNNREPEVPDIDANLLRGTAGLLGVDLGDERAGALVAQAVPHFAMLHQLNDITISTTEPAAEFRLDGRTRSADA